MSALVTVARLAPVLDGLGLSVCSVTMRERLLDVEGPATAFGARPYLSVIDVRVHVLDLDDAGRLATVLGLPEVSREVHDPATLGRVSGTTAVGVDPREHVTWAGLVTLPPDASGDVALLRVEVLAIGPAPVPDFVPGHVVDVEGAPSGVVSEVAA